MVQRLGSGVLELLLCAAAFAVSSWFWTQGQPRAEEAIWSSLLLAVALVWTSQESGVQPWVLGIGVVLMLEFFLVYGGIPGLPLESIVGGIAGSALLVGLLRSWTAPAQSLNTVLVMDDLLPADLMQLLQPHLRGVVAANSLSVPAGVPVLGSPQSLPSLLQARTRQDAGLSFDRLVLGSEHWNRYISASQLLEWKCSGGQVERLEDIYERLLHRIRLDAAQRRGFILPDVMRGNRRMMAFQAVYSNLAGLFLLTLLSPVLLLIGLIASRMARAGTLFEQVECAGFHRIPFQRRRFWTHHTRTGRETGMGRWVHKLGIADLPQLVNVVRGEMAICGPQAVRMEFSQYLEQLLPTFGYRFVMKPGMFGWAQLHETSEGMREHVRLEYDLYYLENGSIFMDLSILTRTVLGR